jgi:hypothetical protein
VKISLPFEKEDLALLRMPGIVFLVSIVIAIALYSGADYLNRNASVELSQARAQYQQAETSVREIADEEATIIRYIDRYSDIEAEGAVSEQDRLALIEQVGEFRARYNLYPIAIDIGEQGSLALSYDPLDLSPGEPVNVNFSEISLMYSLVHEEDLTRLLNALVDESGLMLPNSCDLTTDNFENLNFTQLGFNLSANCKLLWFTFDLAPPEVIYEY